MPGCAAVGCTNSGKKGFLMKHFPRDSSRRKEWLIRTKRGNWMPTDHSCLCEVHFAPEMWEKTRVDGKRKLKLHAIPTVFLFSPAPTKRKTPAIPEIKSEPESVDPVEVISLNVETSIGSEVRPQPSTLEVIK